MVSEQHSRQSQTHFPHPNEALAFGWGFLKRNVWIVVLMAALSGAAAGLAAPFFDRMADSSNVGSALLYVAIGFVIALPSTLFELGLWRRGFDYWDEQNGRAATRSFSAAFRSAIDGAAPRVLPYTGWSILLAALIVLSWAVIALMTDSASDGVVLGVVLVMAMSFALVSFLAAFFALAAADGPGNPLTRSIHVFRGHFWRVVATYLLFFGLLVAVSIPLLIVMIAVSSSTVVGVVQVITAAVVSLLTYGIGSGAKVAMYRAVFVPEAPRS